MIELKLRNILRQVKSSDPRKRYEALDELFEYKQQDNLEIQIDVLKDIVKTAAGKFPEPADSWDNPSYYLIDFVCDFPMEEVVEAIVKHFDGFSLQAKERAIEFLLSTEDEEIFYFLEEKIVSLINEGDHFLIPIGDLESYPVLARDIFDKTILKLHSPHYKFMMYDLLLGVNSSEIEQSYKRETILPLLLADYREAKEQYLKFDPDYSAKYVYTAWKDSYFIVRNRMKLFLNLMEHYFDNEVEAELKQALSFSDPLLRTEAFLVCLKKNITFDKGIIEECARNIETAEMVYWELKDMNLEHLYPIKEEKQPLLAKTRLFTTIINLPEDEDGLARFPEKIEVLDKIETANSYGQPVRYYMMGFSEHGRDFVGYAGGYALEDGDDTAHLWDGTYTDYTELDSLSNEAHKEAFFKKREEEHTEYETSVHFESSPKLSKGMWFFFALLIAHWVRNALEGFEGPLWPSILFTVAGALLAANEFRRNKTKRISIIGRELVLEDGKKREAIALHDIKRVEHNRKSILVYGTDKKLVMKIPRSWVRYEVFYHFMKEHTAHLKDIPFIQPY